MASQNWHCIIDFGWILSGRVREAVLATGIFFLKKKKKKKKKNKMRKIFITIHFG